VCETIACGTGGGATAATGLTWLPKDEHFIIGIGDRLVAHAGLLGLPIDPAAGGSGLRARTAGPA
jgi:hypothetical protein